MRSGRTEVLLGGATLLDNLHDTGLELLDGGNVVGKDTHLTGGGGEVDLGTVIASVSVSATGRSGAPRGWHIHASRAVDSLMETKS